MAKPPFKFKQAQAASPPVSQRVRLVDTEEIEATYSDVFVVVNEADTGLGSIYFYQRRLVDREAVLGATDTVIVSGTTATARCRARILLSQQGIEKLLEALAENRGFTLARKPPPAEAEKSAEKEK